MKQSILIFFFFCGLSIAFSFLSQHIFAASFVLQSSQSSLNQSDEYNVGVALTINAANGTSYFLRGAFYSSGTTKYCGYTHNGTDWYNGPYTTNQGWQHLLPITVTNSSWSGTLKSKLDLSDPGCSSSGVYNFKVQRFTTSGNGTFDNQNEQTLTVIIPTPTPTPTPTQTPTPTLLPTSTSVPTATPKPTATPTLKPTISKSTSLSPPLSPTLISSLSASISGSVLGSSTSPTLVAGISEKKSDQVNIFAVFSIAGGILLFLSCGILFFTNGEKEK